MDGYERSPVEDLVADGEVVEEISFFVAGEPQPKGSTRSFYVKQMDRVVTTTTNKNTKQWQLRIAMEAQHANGLREQSFFDPDKVSAYEVEAEFLFSRPRSLPRRVKANTKRPDLDKLVRAVLDGLADILLPDDSQVVSITARKRYIDHGETPGALISLRRIR